jgi:hypothetical protein
VQLASHVKVAALVSRAAIEAMSSPPVSSSIVISHGWPSGQVRSATTIRGADVHCAWAGGAYAVARAASAKKPKKTVPLPD